MPTYEVALDRDRCCGFGLCAQYAPEVFAQDAAGTAVLVAGPSVPARLHEAAVSAERACPQRVITVRTEPGRVVEQH